VVQRQQRHPPLLLLLLLLHVTVCRFMHYCYCFQAYAIVTRCGAASSTLLL
jgi:hypothetical protein